MSGTMTTSQGGDFCCPSLTDEDIATLSKYFPQAKLGSLNPGLTLEPLIKLLTFSLRID